MKNKNKKQVFVIENSFNFYKEVTIKRFFKN